MRNYRILLALTAALTAVGSANAATQITVTSYDMPNGSGQASGGSYNYWDKSYNGSGSTTTDAAALSGGTGDLTDGYVPGVYWYAVENSAGTGPYVGWPNHKSLNPTITFHFSGSPVIDSIRIHMDNTGYGGVYAPTSFLVDGVLTSFTTPAWGSIGWATASGLNLTGNTHSVQMNLANGWIFVSEVEFFGSTGAVPEPASWAMMIGGFALAGAAMRRRSAKVSFA